MVIGKGRILSDGTLESLRSKISHERHLIVDLEDEGAQVSDADAVVVQRDRNRVQLSFDPTVVSAATLISRITAAHSVRDLFVENPPIEEIVARMYETERL